MKFCFGIKEKFLGIFAGLFIKTIFYYVQVSIAGQPAGVETARAQIRVSLDIGVETARAQIRWSLLVEVTADTCS